MRRTTTKPSCELFETDGKGLSFVNRVGQALRKNGQRKEACFFEAHALWCVSFTELLLLAGKYVEVV